MFTAVLAYSTLLREFFSAPLMQTTLFFFLALRDNFLVDGEARNISWEFLEDLLTAITAEAEKYHTASVEQMDLNNRYPPAGSMFNGVSGQPDRNRVMACGIGLQQYVSGPVAVVVVALACSS